MSIEYGARDGDASLMLPAAVGPVSGHTAHPKTYKP